MTFDRLRFDFNAPRAPTSDELTAIESLVNGWVGDAVALDAREMPIADAKAKGATAMFGEKYGDVVRVVDVPGVSMELCGARTWATPRKSAGSRSSPRRASPPVCAASRRSPARAWWTCSPTATRW